MNEPTPSLADTHVATGADSVDPRDAAGYATPRLVKLVRDPVHVRWARRAVTIPLWFTLFGLYTGLFPFLLLGAGTEDLVRGKLAMPRARCVLFFAFYLAAEVAAILAAMVNFVLAGAPLREPNARLVAMDAALQRAWTAALLRGACVIFGMKTTFEGTELARRGPFLLFVRHASKIDTMLSAVAVANPNRILLRYVLKRELLWDPLLDLVGNVLPNTFIRRGKNAARDEVDAIRALARDVGAADGVLIYPEGTCFEPGKYAASLAKLRAGGNPALVERAERMRHVLPPRLGGALALLDEAPELDVVVCSHTGFEAAVDFTSIWRGGLLNLPIDLKIERFAADTIPRDPDARATWLYDRWLEVDAWIDATRMRREAERQSAR